MAERTRAICPCECKPPKIFPLTPLHNKTGKRVDGRGRDQLRQICMLMYLLFHFTLHLTCTRCILHTYTSQFYLLASVFVFN
jgi:hypothetical protein